MSNEEAASAISKRIEDLISEIEESARVAGQEAPSRDVIFQYMVEVHRQMMDRHGVAAHLLP